MPPERDDEDEPRFFAVPSASPRFTQPYYEIKMVWNSGHEALLYAGSDEPRTVEKEYLKFLTRSPEEIAQLPKVPSQVRVRECQVVEVYCDGQWVVPPSRGALPSYYQRQRELEGLMPPQYEKVGLANGQRATVIPISDTERLVPEVLSLHWRIGRETVVLLGDVSDLDAASQDLLRLLCHSTMKTVWEIQGSLIGRVKQPVINRYLEEEFQSLPLRSTFVCAGVSRKGAVRIPKEVAVFYRDIFLVPGRKSADEAVWLAALTSAFAENHASLAILLGGADDAWQDVQAQLAEHRRVLAVDGTGGIADVLSAAVRGEPVHDPQAILCVGSGLIRTVPLDANEEFERILRTVITSW
jgi:hypothetical protein